ncbi:MAG: hypothetical protein WBD06_17740, partial [Acidobacteriaceae bacterium]
FRGEDGDSFITIPIRTDVVAMVIEPATAVAMREILGVMILDGHDSESLSGSNAHVPSRLNRKPFPASRDLQPVTCNLRCY